MFWNPGLHELQIRFPLTEDHFLNVEKALFESAPSGKKREHELDINI